MLWHHFGFEPFHTAFDSIRVLPPGQRPTNTSEERQTFLVHMSRAVGHDLSDYVRTWGIAIPDTVAAEISHLPRWMPTSPEQESPS
jgi:hypothetical protein